MADAPVAVKPTQPQQSGSGVLLIGRTLFNRTDYNPDLQGSNGTAKYERMRRDPEIAGCLLRWKAPLLAANWTFEPPETGAKNDEMLELCNRYILGDGQEDSRRTFKGGLLPHILLMVDFGCSAIEKVWGVDEKGRQVYARLAPILPQSIREFEIGDMGELLWLVQYAYTPQGFKRQAVPDPEVGGTAEEKIAVFTYRQEGDDYFGRPPLREIYQAWFHKSELWTLDGLQKERSGMGMTVIKVPGILDETNPAFAAAERVVYEMRAHQRNGAVIGEDWELDQKFPSGTAPDIKGSMQYCDEQIARALGAEFQQLGSTPNGTRSLADSKIDHLMLCLQALADMVEEQINKQLVPILIKRNLGPQPEYPRIQCEDLDKMSGTQLSEILSKLGPAGFIKPDDPLEEHLRENLDLTPIDYGTRKEEPTPEEIAAAASTARNAPAPGGDAKPPETKPEPVKKYASVQTQQVAVQPFWRNVMPHEAHVEFASIQDYLDREPQMVWSRVVAPRRSEAIRRIARDAAAASDDDLAAQRLRPHEQSRLAADLTTSLQASYLDGRRAVVDELRRQRVTKADTPEETDDAEYDTQPTKAQLAWIKTLATGFSAAVIGALINEAAKSGLTQRQAENSKAQSEASILRALDQLSVPKVVADLAGAITRAYTTGRNEQIDSMKGEFETYYYSAVMDSGTCPECSSRDGQEHELDDPNYATPSPYCDGGDRCRCVTIAIARDNAQREAA